MDMTQKSLAFIGNDDLYPTEIVFSSGCRVRLACTEEGSLYLREDREMDVTQKSLAFIGNDDLYPTEIVFSDGCSVRLSCAEEGNLYLRVE